MLHTVTFWTSSGLNQTKSSAVVFSAGLHSCMAGYTYHRLVHELHQDSAGFPAPRLGATIPPDKLSLSATSLSVSLDADGEVSPLTVCACVVLWPL